MQITALNKRNALPSFIFCWVIIEYSTEKGGRFRFVKTSILETMAKISLDEVSILTAAAIECAKVGLKRSAFKFAAQIIKPEKRRRIDEKYQKKIETIVR